MYDGLCPRLPHIQASSQRPSLWSRNTQFTAIKYPFIKTAAGQRSFQYIVVSLRSSLDKDLKLSKNHRDFKQKLKLTLFQKFLDPAGDLYVLTFYSKLGILNGK